MKHFFLLLLPLLLPSLRAAPTIGAVRMTPTTAVVGTATPITVQASIADPSLIAGGVNLLALNADGTTTILGILHDDGENGDAFAGDLVFTLVVTLNAAAPSPVRLQVSAAFRGLLPRVKSPVLNVFFQTPDAPQQAIAALAQALTAGNVAGAMNYFTPATQPTDLATLGQTGLSVLTSMLNAATLISAQSDLRIFQAPFVTPGGISIMVELSMVPGPNGQWLINTW